MTKPPYPESIAIRSGDRFIVTPVADIEWVQADGSYARVHCEGQPPRLLTRTLATLSRTILDPDVFVRIHRSAVVNRRRITAVDIVSRARMTVVLKSGARIECSRRSRAALEAELFFTS